MKAFVQTRQGIIANLNIHNAYLGYEERGWETEFFDEGNLSSVAFAPGVVLVGGGRTVLKALSLLGRPKPLLDPYPATLQSFLGRKIWRSNLGDARAQVELSRPPVFVKPTENDRKLFVGLVMSGLRDLLTSNNLPDDLEVLCSEVVNFVSEYRVFLNRGKIVGCKHYKGDFRRSLNFAIVDAAVAAFSDAPAACALDFGVTNEGETLLVEVNDSYSLGSYGLECVTYSRMVQDRWNEMAGYPRDDE